MALGPGVGARFCEQDAEPVTASGAREALVVGRSRRLEASAALVAFYAAALRPRSMDARLCEARDRDMILGMSVGASS